MHILKETKHKSTSKMNTVKICLFVLSLNVVNVMGGLLTYVGLQRSLV